MLCNQFSNVFFGIGRVPLYGKLSVLYNRCFRNLKLLFLDSARTINDKD